jgi:hypothetical protein
MKKIIMLTAAVLAVAVQAGARPMATEEAGVADALSFYIESGYSQDTATEEDEDFKVRGFENSLGLGLGWGFELLGTMTTEKVEDFDRTWGGELALKKDLGLSFDEGSLMGTIFPAIALKGAVGYAWPEKDEEGERPDHSADFTSWWGGFILSWGFEPVTVTSIFKGGQSEKGDEGRYNTWAGGMGFVTAPITIVSLFGEVVVEKTGDEKPHYLPLGGIMLELGDYVVLDAAVKADYFEDEWASKGITAGVTLSF